MDNFGNHYILSTTLARNRGHARNGGQPQIIFTAQNHNFVSSFNVHLFEIFLSLFMIIPKSNPQISSNLIFEQQGPACVVKGDDSITKGT